MLNNRGRGISVTPDSPGAAAGPAQAELRHRMATTTDAPLWVPAHILELPGLEVFSKSALSSYTQEAKELTTLRHHPQKLGSASTHGCTGGGVSQTQKVWNWKCSPWIQIYKVG